MDRASLEPKSAGELRQLLRQHHPQTRGAFAAGATKEQCIRILAGESLTHVVMAEWQASLSVATPDVPEGVGGENPPAVAPHNPVVDPLAKAKDALRILAPDAAEGLDLLVQVKDNAVAEALRLRVELDEARKQRVVAAAPLPVTGTEVELCNRKLPVLYQTDDASKAAELAWVPKADGNFDFGIWRSRMEAGAVTFNQDAGDFIDALIENDRILLTGPPSVGKSALPTQVAARTNWPMIRMAFNRDLTVDDFVGTHEAANGKTQFVYGLLPIAMKIGAIFVADEIFHAPAECTSILHAVMEPNGRLVLTANGGEVIDPHPLFRFVATDNTVGYGDDSGMHPNAQVQDAALLSRFDSVFRVDWPTMAQERNLLHKITGLNKSLCELIAKFAGDTRKAVSNATLQYPVTLRHTISWARKTALHGDAYLPAAFALCVLNKAPSNDRAGIAEIAQRHFGAKIDGVVASDPAKPAEQA